jgi:hypothetical protein
MIRVKNILKKENLVAAAGLGVGSIAAETVTSKVAPMVLKSATAQKYAPAIPILAGMVIQTGTGVVKSVGHGMIAAGVAKAFKEVLPASVKSSVGIDGIGQVMMSGTGTPLMGTQSMDSGFDYTSPAGGEMSY